MLKFAFLVNSEVFAGMDYLHAAGIIHGDLKTANVMLKSTTSDSRGFTCKLGDFGLSHILSSNMFSHVVTQTHGTMAYMPPELLKSGILSRATDVFSFAMVMWELFCGDVRACSQLWRHALAYVSSLDCMCCQFIHVALAICRSMWPRPINLPLTYVLRFCQASFANLHI